VPSIPIPVKEFLTVSAVFKASNARSSKLLSIAFKVTTTLSPSFKECKMASKCEISRPAALA
jgi:hypothetical protein